MTREEAIAVLSDRDNFLWWEMSKAERECYSEVFDMAISALKDRPKGEWIPVTERNPDIYKKVEKYLITDDEEQVRTACFVNCGDACWWDHLHVVAWQPLPEPYKAKSEDKE